MYRRSKHMPNVVAMMKQQACGNSVHEKLFDFAEACVQPVYDFKS